MTTEILVAIIGAVAVVVAAIIRCVSVKDAGDKRTGRSVLSQQITDIQGEDNDIEQTITGSGCLQSSTVKGKRNNVKQNKKLM